MRNQALIQTKKANNGPPTNLGLDWIEENSAAVQLHIWLTSWPWLHQKQEAEYRAVNIAQGTASN